jgi:hypothetical protein
MNGWTSVRRMQVGFVESRRDLRAGEVAQGLDRTVCLLDADRRQDLQAQWSGSGQQRAAGQ